MSAFPLVVASILALSGTAHAAEAVLIRDVAVFDGTQRLPKRNVLLADGKIADADFRGATPAGATEVRCDGCTLLPGLMDSHVHAYANHELPLLLGVTTQLDMFMPLEMARSIKARMAAGKLLDQADLYTAGTLVTTPGGHGTEYGFTIPTLNRAEDADAFIAARLAEGSDFIKLVYDDGKHYGVNFTTLDLPTLTAAIKATHSRGKLAVVHVSTQAAAKDAVAAGADGLVHQFTDSEVDDAFVQLARQKKVFIIPTYAVNESVYGRAGGTGLLAQPAIADMLDAGQQGVLKQVMRPVDRSARLDALMRASLGKLKAAGVPILAGTDAGNPGTLHGASLHRELELLTQAGLSASEALAAATSLPAKAFGLQDSGRIAKGMKANLLLVKGDPTVDIRATRDIVEVWKAGTAVSPLRQARQLALQQAAAKAALRPQMALPADGKLGLFSSDAGKLVMAAPFGKWQENLDTVMNGKSQVALSAGTGPTGQVSLKLDGELKPGFAYPWAGVAFNPGKQPFAPTDLSAAKGIRFKVRGDGATYALQAFWQAGGYQPAAATFKAEADWREVKLEWASLKGFDPKTTTWLGLVAAMRTGPFRFELADVGLIPN